MLENLFEQISLEQIDTLLLLGLALFGGTFGGKVFQRLKIPQVVGYIAIGILMGRTGLNFVDEAVIYGLQPINYFALGLIGFMIGGELKKEVFIQYGKQFVIILLFEGLTTFIGVMLLIGGVASFFMPIESAAALGILMGAIASSTAPAATTEVLREYKTRGPLTTIIQGIVALDDGLSLVLFALATSITGVIMGQSVNHFISFLLTIYEIAGALVVGVLLGWVLTMILVKYGEDENLLVFSLGVILITLGLSKAIEVDMLLAAMTAGFFVANFAPKKCDDMFKLIGKFTPPIYVLFFVLVGAKLNVRNMPVYALMLAIAYLIGRSSGKMSGAYLGALVAKSKQKIIKNLPLCLFSQGGVAIGLSIIAGQRFAGEIGSIIVLIITFTTFIVEIIGPTFVKVAVQRAEEVGLNITEEDLMNKSLAKELMEPNVPIIKLNTKIDDVIKSFSEYNNLYYPVVGDNKTLLGVITIDHIKEVVLNYMDFQNIVIAYDLMEDVPVTAQPETRMTKVLELMRSFHTDYIPIVSDGNKLEGIIEKRSIENLISKKLLEIRKKSEEEV